MSVFILSIGFWNYFCCSLSGFIGGFNLLISPILILSHLEVQHFKATINKQVLVEVEHHDAFLYQIETRKKSDPQMGFEPRILRDLNTELMETLWRARVKCESLTRSMICLIGTLRSNDADDNENVQKQLV